MLTRKHFEMVAEAIAETRRECSADSCTASTALDEVTDRLADRFFRENRNFNLERFRAAAR